MLYDDGGPWGWLGEVYAIQAGQLASHFGAWTAKPAGAYRAGDLAETRAVVYVGSTFGASLPDAFLDDVLAGTRPVVWLGGNVWQLSARDTGFAAKRGFAPGLIDASRVSEVRYKGVSLGRSPDNAAGIVACSITDPARAAVLATAVRGDGTEVPWAIRSGALTYVAELPFAYVDERDRYLALADLLFDALAPDAPERHRALARIEDVTPRADPAALRALADVLAAAGAPFGVAVVPVYVDPLGAASADHQPQLVRMRDAPEVVDALRYMIDRGGTLVLHGYTHQLGVEPNPYDAVSADDFEFWTAHVDAENRVVYDGPAPFDSPEFAEARVRAGLEELRAAGLPAPAMFEYPHYAGSPVDSRAIAAILPTAWQRGLYVDGLLGGRGDGTHYFQQLFPYDVVDVYGFRVLPENLGNYQPVPQNAGVPVRLVPDLIANAHANRVVRDGTAAFFFHPYFPPDVLRSIVLGVQGEGYTFVSPSEL